MKIFLNTRGRAVALRLAKIAGVAVCLSALLAGYYVGVTHDPADWIVAIPLALISFIGGALVELGGEA
jgi:hypothetical protein